ncbi:glycosyltransferase family 2 protein [Algoriphagus litoralis]|uniref:glycosyltransferase family 2 protein n=1 Tax=Algoriphagus litoralis TaxID=2202829 RepID=UPI000DB9F55E|nr:glycosyltransferase family 2 protein [Algoriphagus litoralis]
MIKFSICIPAYKSEYLKECIQSILNQTVSDFELIILNDHSPEPVKEVVASIEDPRIRYFENEKNVGSVDLVDNWNQCLSYAIGEFVIIMGDDDLLRSDYLEEFIRLIETFPDLEVYHCRSLVIDDMGSEIMLTPALPQFEYVYDSIWHRLHQLRSNYISDYVYRTETLKHRGGFFKLPLAWGSDDISAFIASAEKGIAHTNTPVFRYRSNRLSITSTGSDIHKMEADLGYADWLEAFMKNNPPKKQDEVVYAHLSRNLQHYIKLRKVYTMMVSMRSSRFKKMLMWIKGRKKYNLTIGSILVAFLKSFN